MHQTDTLFHKSKAFTSFMFGGEADNHALNTVPKETLVRVTKAEDGGLGGKGVWSVATKGATPGNENPEDGHATDKGDLIPPNQFLQQIRCARRSRHRTAARSGRDTCARTAVRPRCS